eukprot:CAMPEP_0197418264 /NCGR_PEP_ID=MMETSP1170-20131217/4049_1 /TAXON_ID=54406 /ORGANISM="Sarcinochrysis sp, Strain CCMP770" /LENGTH=58 /DNA_ID=CAMNT_0042945291 /DNA_START=38 /DNA_END=214 /DNA_ORIENTATION=+
MARVSFGETRDAGRRRDAPITVSAHCFVALISGVEGVGVDPAGLRRVAKVKARFRAHQ